jgi:uncharacterized membrane protein YesL
MHKKLQIIFLIFIFLILILSVNDVLKKKLNKKNINNVNYFLSIVLSMIISTREVLLIISILKNLKIEKFS